MGMGGICHIGELMELSKLEKRKKQKREWYERNCENVLEQQKNSENKKDNQKEWYVNNKDRVIEKSKRWNKLNKGARKLIVDRYQKGKRCQEWASATRK